MATPIAWSDSSDDSDSLLGGGRLARSRRERKKNVKKEEKKKTTGELRNRTLKIREVYHSGSDDDDDDDVDDDDEINKAIAVSRASFEEEQRRRKQKQHNLEQPSSESKKSATLLDLSKDDDGKVNNGIIRSNNNPLLDDSFDSLELNAVVSTFLSKKQKKHPSEKAESGANKRNCKEDDDDDAGSITHSISDKKSGSGVTVEHVDVVGDRKGSLFDTDDDVESLHTMKWKSSPAASKAAPAPAPSVAAMLPSTTYEGDSSDSSLSVLKKSLGPRRCTKPLVRKSRKSSDSSSDDDMDSKQLLMKATARLGRRKPACSSRKPPPPKAATARRATSKTAEEREREAEEKQQERLEREEQRKRAREEREVAKKREKEAKADQRERDRIAKRLAKEQAVQSKKRQRDKNNQAAGKFATQEIAVLLEPDLIRNDRWKFGDDLQDAGYTVHEYPSGLGCKAVQWIRKDHLMGGAEAAVKMLLENRKDSYEHLPVLVVVFDEPDDFLCLLERCQHSEEDDYPQLEIWLRGIETGWRAAWRVAATSNGDSVVQRPRILVMLNKVKDALDHKWVEYQKHHKRKKDHEPPPTAEELEDAVTWLLIQFQVECVYCSSHQDVSHNLTKMTRVLAEEPYQKQVTELECVKKIKAGCSDLDPPFQRSQDCWIRQLQQVPRVSDRMARSLVQHFPTARSLWLAYQDDDLTEDEKRLLTANLFSDRAHLKVSHWLHRLLTSQDPNEMLR